MNRFVSCMVDSIDSTCGPEAAQWHREVIVKLLAPTLEEVHCTLGREATFANDLIDQHIRWLMPPEAELNNLISLAAGSSVQASVLLLMLGLIVHLILNSSH